MEQRDSARFWSKVDKTEGCWEWRAHRNEDGYGQIGVGGKVWRAHRLAWTLVHGEISAGQHVLHACDNPGCVNPAHLRLGTHDDNMDDVRIRGRAHRAFGNTSGQALKGERNGRARLDAETVRWLRWAREYSGRSYPQIGKVMGLSAAAVRHAVSGLRWSHV
jgi:hypothetical protein